MTTILFLPIPTAACSCAEPNSVHEELEQSSAVFQGKVMEIKDSSHTRKVLFEVKESWKGIEQTQIIVVTGMGSGDCGYDFNIGQEYLVYAKGEQSLSTNICDRTSSVQSVQVSEDLEKLGQGITPNTIVDLSNEFNMLPGGIWIWVGAGVIIIIIIVALSKKWRKSY